MDTVFRSTPCPAVCCCGGNPGEYEGPLQTCPVHGDDPQFCTGSEVHPRQGVRVKRPWTVTDAERLLRASMWFALGFGCGLLVLAWFLTPSAPPEVPGWVK